MTISKTLLCISILCALACVTDAAATQEAGATASRDASARTVQQKAADKQVQNLQEVP